MRNLVIVCIAASTLTGCAMVGAQCVTATYESSDCHANGTPVTAAEKAEGARRHIETCRHLYQMFGDRTLSPMQVEVARTEWNARFCSSSGFVP